LARAFALARAFTGALGSAGAFTGALGSAGAFAGAFAWTFTGAGDFRSTEGRHHDGVIPVPPLALTAARGITGHMADARVIKVGSRNSASAGLAMPAGFRRCGRRHTLTFHCSNGLLKPLEPPALFGGTGVLPGFRQSPSTRSLSPSPGGYIAHEPCYLRRDIHHFTDDHDRGRPDALSCHHAFHLFQ
jgi:hypothetical protein